MTRVEPNALEHHDLTKVFIAARLKEARQVEELLTGYGVDYMVKVEPFIGGIFSAFRPRQGAVFYVQTTQASFCRDQLTAAGLGRGVVEEDEES